MATTLPLRLPCSFADATCFSSEEDCVTGAAMFACGKGTATVDPTAAASATEGRTTVAAIFAARTVVDNGARSSRVAVRPTAVARLGTGTLDVCAATGFLSEPPASCTFVLSAGIGFCSAAWPCATSCFVAVSESLCEPKRRTGETGVCATGVDCCEVLASTSPKLDPDCAVSFTGVSGFVCIERRLAIRTLIFLHAHRHDPANPNSDSPLDKL